MNNPGEVRLSGILVVWRTFRHTNLTAAKLSWLFTDDAPQLVADHEAVRLLLRLGRRSTAEMASFE
jgi:hypothetical protein